MVKFQIPEIFKPGFEALAQLDGKSFNMFAEVVKGLPPGNSLKIYAEKINKLPLKGIEDISKTILSLGNLQSSFEGTPQQLADDLADSFAFLKASEGEQITTEAKSVLSSKILTILKCENLRLTFKALNLVSENDQIFRDARVVSDVRLIFNDDLKDQSRSGVIIHRLKLEYQKNSSLKEFYLSLATDDLQKLRRQIDRALEKEVILKSDYSNINFIEINESL
jgi:hypothetical protein